jgi:DNA repair protein SbcD/Mre11
MFKFIHAADVHLDSPLRGLSRYESAPVESLRNACRKAFENLVDLAVEEQVAFVLLAGDLYDGDWKDYSTGIFLSRQMGRLARNGIQVFAIAGNHDAANRMTRTLDTLGTMKMFSSTKVETVELKELGVAIHGRSFGTQHVDTNLARDFGPSEQGMFNIGLLHTSLDGREGHARYAPCTSEDLRSKGYQYWALGHVHRQEFVCEDPYIVFPGCIQGRHIRETGAKGCVLVTVHDRCVKVVETCPLDVLRWVNCIVDLTDASDMAEVVELARISILNERASADGRPVAMRIRFQGATAMSNELYAYPERFEQRLRALGAETVGDDLWMERVEIGTVSKLDLETVVSEGGAFGKLLEDILTTPANPNGVAGFDDVLSDIRQRIPPEAFGDHSFLNLDEFQTIERLFDQAKHLLLGRLLTVGDAK